MSDTDDPGLILVVGAFLPDLVKNNCTFLAERLDGKCQVDARS